MKKLWILFLVALLIIPVSATPDPRPVRDGAVLLEGMQTAEVADALDEINRTYGIDILIVTTKTLDGRSARAYANNYYDNYCFADSGILLLLAMEERDWYVLTEGTCKKAVDLDVIEDNVIPYFSDGRYYEGFLLFADIVDTAMENRNADGSVIVGNDGTVTYRTAKWYDSLWLIILIGLIAGGISVAVMAGSMKNVRKQGSAGAYVTEGGLELTRQEDRFLYQTVTRRPKPKSSSSSGGSRGGRGGKF